MDWPKHPKSVLIMDEVDGLLLKGVTEAVKEEAEAAEIYQRIGCKPLPLAKGPRNTYFRQFKAKPFIKESRIEEIVDPNIKAGYHAEAMWRVAEVALGCIRPFSTDRPCMADIVREVEDALIIKNNASENMKSIESIGGSNRFLSIEKKILAFTSTPSEPSPIFSQTMAPPQLRLIERWVDDRLPSSTMRL